MHFFLEWSLILHLILKSVFDSKDVGMPPTSDWVFCLFFPWWTSLVSPCFFWLGPGRSGAAGPGGRAVLQVF